MLPFFCTEAMFVCLFFCLSEREKKNMDLLKMDPTCPWRKSVTVLSDLLPHCVSYPHVYVYLNIVKLLQKTKMFVKISSERPTHTYWTNKMKTCSLIAKNK
jgi:hypothetical protein